MHQDCVPSLTSIPIHINQVEPNWRTRQHFFHVLPHSPSVRAQAAVCLHELKHSSFTAYWNAFSQISFRRLVPKWTLLERLQEGYISAAQEAYQSNFDTARKDLGLTASTEIQETQLVLSKDWAETHLLWHTDSTSFLTAQWALEVTKTKFLTCITDKVEFHFASRLLKYL